jgi:glycosyltransferase involved in cell wall biosynthesis
MRPRTMTQPRVFDWASRVAIDGRAISHPQPGGFKTYSENLVKHLPELDDSVNYEIILDRPVAKQAISSRPNVSVRVIRNAIPVLGVPFRENVALPWHLLHSAVDLVHFPNASAALWSPRPFVITIHDAMELMPMSAHYGGASVKRNLMHLYNRFNQTWAARKAEAIITVSQCSKRDIARWLNVSEDRIFVTYAAPDEAFSRIADASQLVEVRQKYGVEENYILGIGSADPRKNIQGLIRAYSQLPSALIARYQLAIVLTHRRFQESLHSLTKTVDVTDRVRYLTSVPNADLAGIYSGAGLFVFPSLYEGFGLPPLEAMACGAPVIAASNSCIAEILGEAAVLVKDVNPAGDLAELTRGMTQILNDGALRFSLSQQGPAHARSFSWARCARETLNVYGLALESSRSKQASQSKVRFYR